MPTTIERESVLELLERGAHVIEVLGSGEYNDQHIAGAINIPLAKLVDQSNHLERDRPIIVYCADYQCDLSARAAWLLESRGFRKVHRYKPGKADWVAAGLPTEGEKSQTVTALDRARLDVPTCSPSDQIEEVRRRGAEAGWDYAVVVNDQGVLVGSLKLGDELYPPSEVASVMDSAPLTLRPGYSLEKASRFMRKNDAESILVTSSDGEFIGILYAEDAAQERAEQKDAAAGQAS